MAKMIEDANYERALAEAEPDEMDMQQSPEMSGMETAQTDDPMVQQIADYFEQQSGLPAELTITIINAYKDIMNTSGPAGSPMQEEPAMSPLAAARMEEE